MGENRNVPAVPEPIDRAALERVLARAAELQARTADAPDNMSESDLMALGNEVGISTETLRQALAEERTRGLAPTDTGVAARILGSATVSVSRAVKGTPEVVLARFGQWMEREEALTVQRRSPTRVTWEARSDLVGSVQRAFNLGGRGYALSRASEVAATVSPLDGERVHLRLDANLVGLRQSRLRTGSVLAAICVVSTGVLLTLNFMLPVALIGVAVSPIALWQTARSFRPAVNRAQAVLEHYLDRLEHNEEKRPPSLLDLLSGGRPPR